MSSPGFLYIPAADHILALHSQTIALQGGAKGLRDESGFLSIWSRAEAAQMYGTPDPLAIGARLAHGMLKAHPFLDGNKRSAWAALSLTLVGNGWRCDLEPEQAAREMIRAAGSPESAEALEAALRPFCRQDPVFQHLFDFDSGKEDPAP